jgi:hypothetical protein
MLTTITADDIRNARLMGDAALRNLLAKIPSVETASTEETTAFIAAMERPHA